MPKPIWFEGHYYRKKQDRASKSGYRQVRRILKIDRVDGKLTNDSEVTYRDRFGVGTCSLATMRASYEPVLKAK